MSLNNEHSRRKARHFFGECFNGSSIHQKFMEQFSSQGGIHKQMVQYSECRAGTHHVLLAGKQLCTFLLNRIERSVFLNREHTKRGCGTVIWEILTA